MNAQTNLPAERRPAEIDVFKTQLSKKADEFQMVLPSHISIDKFQRTIATAALSNPQLLECNRQSLLLASMKLAQDGLLPDGREAALVPFKVWDKNTKQTNWQVQPMPMAYGLRKKILQSGEVISIETGVIYRSELESGHFIYEIGLEPPIRHRPDFSLSAEDMEDSEIVGAYSIARLRNEHGGDPYWSVEVMRRVEIDKVRQTSQTGAVGRVVKGGPNKGKPIEPSGPWVDWFSEMARKTVLRRHSKVLPMSGDILDAFERDIESERAADSAARFLDVQESQPKVLPSRSDIDGEQVNPETGEITEDEPRTDSRGMTEVDENTARELDSQQPNDGTLSDDNPDAGEGPADEQRGEAESQSEAAEQTRKDIDGPLDDDAPAWKPHVDAVHDALDKAKTKAAVDKAEGEFLKISGGLPDDVVSELEGKIRETRKTVMAKKEG